MIDDIDNDTMRAIDDFYSNENSRFFDKSLEKRIWPIGTRLYTTDNLRLPSLAESGLDSYVKLFHLEESTDQYEEYVGKIGIGIVSVRIFEKNQQTHVQKTLELYNFLEQKGMKTAQMFHREKIENGNIVIIKNYIPGPRPEDLISLMNKKQLTKDQMTNSFNALKFTYHELATNLISNSSVRNEFFHHANKILDQAIDALDEKHSEAYWNKILNKIDSLYLYYFPGDLPPISVHDFKYYEGEWILSSI
ncbi:MAG: hypothetical protein H6622_14070 [Halobacteriovoraceae bacterium]|nr:hypothetical protein [Halobacteriovoraceae bacterium]